MRHGAHILLGVLSSCSSFAAGCSPEPASANLELGREGVLRSSDRQAEASADIDRFASAPDWQTFVALLGRDHASARALLGPHRLRYTAQFSTGPAQLPPEAPLPPVRVGEPTLEHFSVADQLELVWAASAGEGPRMQLEQHNDQQHGRALIVIGDRVWSQLDGREWYERPLETNLWQLWADDAQHAVLDLVELAGPVVELDRVELEEAKGRELLRVTLRASEQRHPERVVEALVPWRRDAQVELGAATILLDRRTGLWMGAQLDLSWSFRDRAGREMRGSASLEGSVEVLDPAPSVEPPPSSSPLPERDRPELLRQRMLDGLAAY